MTSSDVKLTKNQRKKLKKKEKKGAVPDVHTLASDNHQKHPEDKVEADEEVEVEYVSASYEDDASGLISEFKQIFEKFAKPEGAFLNLHDVTIIDQHGIRAHYIRSCV